MQQLQQAELFLSSSYRVHAGSVPGTWTVEARPPKPVLEVMSVAQAAQLLRLSTRTVQDAIQRGELDAGRKTTAPRSPYEVTRASVIAFDRRRRTRA